MDFLERDIAPVLVRLDRLAAGIDLSSDPVLGYHPSVIETGPRETQAE